MPAGSINGFELIEKIGQGGMAIVWKARQLSLDRVVAIKVLLPEFSSDPDETQSFVKEARAVAKLKHNSIVQVYDVAQEGEAHYFVMEFISGLTLLGALQKDGPMGSKKALTIALDVAAALDYAWNSAQIIHRDIKPENIMMDGDGTIKVADLGLYLQKTNLPTPQGYSLEGTPNYMSPEQAQGRAVADVRTDMYSLGATLYQLVTGVMPFADQDPMAVVRMQQNGHIDNPRDINPKISMPMANLITKLMMKNVQDRYDDWPAVLQDIKKAMAGRIIVLSDQEKNNSTVSPHNPKNVGAAAAAAAKIKPRQKGASGAVASRSKPRVDVATEEAAKPSRRSAPIWAVSLVWLGVAAVVGFVGLAALSGPPAQGVGGSDGMVPLGPGTPTAQSPTPAQPSSPTPPVTTPPATSTQPQMNAVINNVMDDLLAENFTDALRTIGEAASSASGSAQTEARNLEDFVRDIQRAERAVEGGLIRKVGQRITTKTTRGQPVQIEINDISRGVIYATRFATVDGQERSSSIQIPMAKYDVEERLAAISSRNTPPDNAYKFILYMNAGDTTRARELAPNCGPFANAFRQKAN